MFGATLFHTVFALAACLGAVAVVVSQSVVRMAFWLIVSLSSVAALFFLADADFVGATQLLIYVGGTVVLLVFGVMLTASGPYTKIETSPGETVIAGLLGIMFLFLVYSTTSGVDWGQLNERLGGTAEIAASPGFSPDVQGQTLRPLGLSLLGVRADSQPGGPALPGYLLPFEIVSIHLLVVLIGASYLARAKKKVDSEGSGETA